MPRERSRSRSPADHEEQHRQRSNSEASFDDDNETVNDHERKELDKAKISLRATLAKSVTPTETTVTTTNSISTEPTTSTTLSQNTQPPPTLVSVHSLGAIPKTGSHIALEAIQKHREKNDIRLREKYQKFFHLHSQNLDEYSYEDLVHLETCDNDETFLNPYHYGPLTKVASQVETLGQDSIANAFAKLKVRPTSSVQNSNILPGVPYTNLASGTIGTRQLQFAITSITNKQKQASMHQQPPLQPQAPPQHLNVFTLGTLMGIEQYRKIISNPDPIVDLKDLSAGELETDPQKQRTANTKARIASNQFTRISIRQKLTDILGPYQLAQELENNDRITAQSYLEQIVGLDEATVKLKQQITEITQFRQQRKLALAMPKPHNPQNIEDFRPDLIARVVDRPDNKEESLVAAWSKILALGNRFNWREESYKDALTQQLIGPMYNYYITIQHKGLEEILKLFTARYITQTLRTKVAAFSEFTRAPNEALERAMTRYDSHLSETEATVEPNAREVRASTLRQLTLRTIAAPSAKAAIQQEEAKYELSGQYPPFEHLLAIAAAAELLAKDTPNTPIPSVHVFATNPTMAQVNSAYSGPARAYQKQGYTPEKRVHYPDQTDKNLKTAAINKEFNQTSPPATQTNIQKGPPITRQQTAVPIQRPMIYANNQTMQPQMTPQPPRAIINQPYPQQTPYNRPQYQNMDRRRSMSPSRGYRSTQSPTRMENRMDRTGASGFNTARQMVYAQNRPGIENYPISDQEFLPVAPPTQTMQPIQFQPPPQTFYRQQTPPQQFQRNNNQYQAQRPQRGRQSNNVNTQRYYTQMSPVGKNYRQYPQYQQQQQYQQFQDPQYYEYRGLPYAANVTHGTTTQHILMTPMPQQNYGGYQQNPNQQRGYNRAQYTGNQNRGQYTNTGNRQYTPNRIWTNAVMINNPQEIQQIQETQVLQPAAITTQVKETEKATQTKTQDSTVQLIDCSEEEQTTTTIEAPEPQTNEQELSTPPVEQIMIPMEQNNMPPEEIDISGLHIIAPEQAHFIQEEQLPIDYGIPDIYQEEQFIPYEEQHYEEEPPDILEYHPDETLTLN